MAEAPKQKFDFAYWLQQLMDVGRQLEPAKFTPEYMQKMERLWRGQPMTMLHQRVLKRRNDLVIKQTTI